MIDFYSETDFKLQNQELFASWISKVVNDYDFSLGDVTFIFCDDEFLHKINLEYLNHDTLTDIISFDYSLRNEIHGEVYISIERVKENAKEFNESFDKELKRVIIHGILHFLGFKDKTDKEQQQMRFLEEKAIDKFPTN